MLSLALLGAGAVAFARQRKAVLVLCLGMFVPVSALATLAVYWPLSPVLATVLLCVGEGLPLVALGLYGADLLFAPFCVEMTYAVLVCWVLWPVLVLANFLGPLV